MKSKLLILLLGLVWANMLHGQTYSNLSLAAGGHWGFLLYHHKNMRGMATSHIKAMELELGFRCDGKKNWHHLYRFPQYGASLTIFNLGSPDYLGTGIALYPFIKFPLAGGKFYQLHFRTGAGLGYVEKIFEINQNNKATAIGSHLNAYINLRLSSYIRLYKSLVLDFGLGLSHFSNGGSKKPNRGINVPTVNLSLVYEVGHGKEVKKDTSRYIFQKHRVFMILSGGFAQLSKPGGSTYGAASLQTFYDFRPTVKSSFGAGLDLMYFEGNREKFRRDSVQVGSPLENIQVGGKVFYQFNMHRLMVPIEFGFYAYSKNKSVGFMYHRIGLRYQVSKHLLFNLTLKTHFAVAEYIEWGLGWKF
ncbi:MAG: acyloxyacyl hydrolase [Bacteroidia bacterium]|nr:acyloxyacyl hydrolase [Bacteroidia bacterium]